MSKPTRVWVAFCITLVIALWICVVWCGLEWIYGGGLIWAMWAVICAVMAFLLAWSLDRRNARG